MNEAIGLSNVWKKFGTASALSNLSFSVPAGSLAVILGPSGCGKSTLLKCIAGLEQADGGSIRLCGKQISSGTPPEQRNLAIMFQEPSLFPHLTVSENIAFPLRVRGVAEKQMKDAVDDMLTFLGLSLLGGLKPRQLSGGEQQRVALGRAVVFNPPLVLLDEPLSALDRPLREALQDELRVIQRRSGATFLMVTHDRDEAMALADIIIVLNDGKLEQIGTAIDLYRRPANRFVATFFGRANVMCGQVRRNGDECTVIGTGGLMLYKRSGPLPDGAYAEIAVNPEQLKLHMTNCDSSDGRHRGRVKSLKYAGESTWVTFESAEGVLIARTPSEVGSKFFEGDEVDFEVNAAETTFLTTQP